ncbi:MAG: hypothetical protein QE277_00845 [Flectobacillus sp.]|nr:hypothetical protein [Flectobacillus sp.]
MKISLYDIIALFFILFAFIVFEFVAKDDIYTATDTYQNNGFRLYADHPTYVNAYLYMDNFIELVLLRPNFLGPILVIWLCNNNLSLIFLFNSTLFLISIYIFKQYYENTINSILYLLLTILNPILIVSLFSANKEIFTLLSSTLFIIAIDRKNIRFLMLSFIIGLFARKELSVFFIMMYMIFNINFKWYNYKLLIIISIIIGISFLDNYINNTFQVIGEYLRESEETTKNSDSGGLINNLNDLQYKFGYWLVFVPKVMLNLFGSIFKINLLFDLNDVYNNIIITIQSILFLFLIPLVVIKVMQSDSYMYRKLFFSFLIFCIFFSFIPIVQNRYFYPCYILLIGIVCINPTSKYNSNLP